MPAAIAFINDDLTTNVKNMLVRQLHITEVIDGYTFNSRLAQNPSYPTEVKAANQRILVILDLTGPDNRNLIDVVLFVKNGLVTVIQNNVTGQRLDSHNPYFPLGCYTGQPQPQPQDPDSVRTQHHLYPDQLNGLQYRGFEINRFMKHHGPPAMTHQIVNLSWGALGIY